MLTHLKNCKKTVGLKQTLKALQNNETKTVILAKDAEDRIIEEINNLCNIKGIPVTYVDEMRQLGKACNIDVGASVVSILK